MVIDANGRVYEGFFMLSYTIGAQMLLNLVIAVLGSSYGAEDAKQKEEAAQKKKLQAIVKVQRRKRAEAEGTMAAGDGASKKAGWLSGLKRKVGLGPKAEGDGDGDGDGDGGTGPPKRPLRPRNVLREKAFRFVEGTRFKLFIITMIVANTVQTAVDGPFIKGEYGFAGVEYVLNILNYVFGGVFTLEFLLKVFALGPREYAADRLNLFDGFMVLMFAIETSLLGAGVTTNVFKAMRTFRVVRIFKVLRRIRTFRTLFGKMAKAIRTVMPMSLVLVIVLFMLSILALQLFQDMYSAPYGICDAPEMVEAAASAACSRKPRYHYDNFPMAFITVFQVMTTDNWPWLMYETYNASGYFALFFFPAVIIIGNIIVLNLFLAILLANFSGDDDEDAHGAERGSPPSSPEKAPAKGGGSKRRLTEASRRGSQMAERAAGLPGPLRRLYLWWGETRDAKAAEKVRRLEKARREAERLLKKQKQSLMRATTSKYGALNAWEVAYFKDKFAHHDLDGDGFLTLGEVHDLLHVMKEEPQSSRTWDLLDTGAENGDLITQGEFLNFLSIKRSEDQIKGAQEENATLTGAEAAKKERLRARMKLRAARRRGWSGWLKGHAERVGRHLSAATVEKLPALGEFATDALGAERSRNVQRIVYSKALWYITVACICVSSMLLTQDIDRYVYEQRRAAGAPTLSDGGRFNEWTIIISDAIFMLLTGVDILLRCVTEGARFWTHPWHYLDALVLLVSILKLCFKQELQRSLTAACSLRILMLLPRFGELRKLSEAILRALPAMLVTFAATSIVWVIFAILAVNMYGGMFWQCVALADAAGVPGCGVPLAANSSSEFDTSGVFSRYTDPIGCRYAPAPLAVPHGVVPGATTSAQCGCTFEEQKVTYGGERIEISVNARVGCAPTTIDGVEVAWLPGYPNFDNFGKAFVALFQISTLDGWSNLMYFAMDVTALETQPHRESELWSPILYFFVFIIFGVLFITNIFVGVVIDEFQKIKREYDGSAFLTDEQASWVNTQRLIFRLKADRVQIQEPGGDQPKRRWCFRLIYDADEHGKPSNAPEEAVYWGERFENGVAIAICLNIAALTLYGDPMSANIRLAYEVLNVVFVVLFAGEAGLKIGAYTFRHYIKGGWNRFDFALVVVSIASLIFTTIVDATPGAGEGLGGVMAVLRCLRVLRILRLSQVAPGLLKMMRTFFFAMPSIANITVIIGLVVLVFAQIGMSFFGTILYDHDGAGFNRHANFEQTSTAFHFLFRMATGDAWSSQLADAIHNPHVSSVNPPPAAFTYAFFLAFMALMGWVLISIFVAIILDYFNEASAEDALSITYEHVELFQRKWLEFDPRSTSYIRRDDLGLLLFTCDPPLVAVQERGRDGLFDAGGEWVKPDLPQLAEVLRELDVPEHDGEVHFLEVLLSLLQRVTGVVSEEKIMASLLAAHPKYLPSIKRMARITGSTSDPFVRNQIMAHLRRGLEETGLLDELEGGAAAGSGGGDGARRNSASPGGGSPAGSFLRPTRASVSSPTNADQRRASLATFSVARTRAAQAEQKSSGSASPARSRPASPAPGARRSASPSGWDPLEC